MLTAARAVDEQEACRPLRVIMGAPCALDGGSRLEPVYRQVMAGIGEAILARLSKAGSVN